MMGVGASDARDMSFSEYQARLWHWNKRHETEEEDDVEAPAIDFVQYRHRILEERGIGRMVH